jgi:hypothetical protein
MAIEFTEQDHDGLDRLLDTILTWHKRGEIDLSEARAALAHVVCAVAIDNPRVKKWLNDPEVAARWKKGAVDDRPIGRGPLESSVFSS